MKGSKYLFAHQGFGYDPAGQVFICKSFISLLARNERRMLSLYHSTYPRTWPPPLWTACETKPINPMLPPPYTRSIFLATFMQKRPTQTHTQKRRKRARSPITINRTHILTTMKNYLNITSTVLIRITTDYRRLPPLRSKIVGIGKLFFFLQKKRGVKKTEYK